MGANENPAEINGANKKNDTTKARQAVQHQESSGHLTSISLAPLTLTRAPGAFGSYVTLS